MQCGLEEYVGEPKCPCKSCLLRNVHSDELEEYLRDHAKASDDQEDSEEFSQDQKNNNLKGTKIVLLVVKSADQPPNMNNNKNMGNPNARGMMQFNETFTKPTCEPCGLQNNELRKSPSMFAVCGHCASKLLDQQRGDSKCGAFNSQTKVECDYHDRCKKEKRCGQQHPIIIRKPICKANQKKGKGGICDAFAESDDDECKTECANTCWCDMQRLEHTFSRIVPNEDCMCYCKTPPEPPKIPKKKNPPKPVVVSDSRYWKLDPIILYPRPCHLDRPCRCREWRGYHPRWPDPRSVYRCDYMPYC